MLHWKNISGQFFLHSVDAENLKIKLVPIYGFELLPKYGSHEELVINKSVLTVIVRPSKGKKVHLHFDLDGNGFIKDEHDKYWFDRSIAEEELLIVKSGHPGSIT